MLFYFWQLIPKAIKVSEEQQLYLQFIARLAPFDLRKQPSETPLQFAERASQRVPWHAQQINTITNKYVQLRYGKKPVALVELKNLIKAFKPKKRKPSSADT